jgi:hypothetical protein
VKNSPLKRYYPLLWEIRATFGGGILAGIIYGIASGFGLPTIVSKVFPLLFRDQEKMKDVPLWVIDFQQKRLYRITHFADVYADSFDFPAPWRFGLCQHLFDQ